MAPINDTDISRVAWALAKRQLWVITGAQLRELGFTHEAIKHRIAKGRVHRIWHDVFSVGRPTLTREQLWMGAVLAGGKGSVLSHASAAACLGIWPRQSSPRAGIQPIHVTVPRGRRMRIGGIRPHQARDMPPPRYVGPIPVAHPLWTLVDLTPMLGDAQLALAVKEADSRGLIGEEATETLAGLRQTQAVRRLRDLLAGHIATDSDLEDDFLRLVARAGLPAPRTQQRVRGYRVDFHWPELRLVVETDGLTYHRTPAQQAKDRRRDQRLTAAGLTCLRFTDAQVQRRGDEVVRILREVMRRTGGPADAADRRTG